MKVLFYSYDLLAGDVARRLVQEGHNVKLFIEDKDRRKNFEGLVEKTDDWKKELSWVGKNGLIVFDSVGYGALQDDLRSKGYNVFGGSEKGELLEIDRKHGQEIFEQYGITVYPIESFSNYEDAERFLLSNDGPWVLKQNDQTTEKDLNYVGQLSDGQDVLQVLKSYTRIFPPDILFPIYLQKRIDGIEIACCRFFNGNDWVGPIELSIEHKKFFPGDVGPNTGEMGTLTQYTKDENNKLFQLTLAKMTDYLRSVNYRGVFDINSIVNEQGVFPLEATTRFGCPIVHLQTDFYHHKWGDYLMAVAKGENYKPKVKSGFGVVLFLVVPPFPYTKKLKEHSSEGVTIYLDKVTDEETDRIHFEEVSVRKVNGKNEYYISDSRGYVLYVTAIADTIEKARTKSLDLAQKIIIPKVMYRHDIGLKYLSDDENLLKSWGFV